MLAFILAAIGTLGIGGFIALALFAPPIAAALAKGATEIIAKLWATRGGLALLVGASCFAAGLFYGDHQGAHRVQARWDAARAAAAEQARERDRGAARMAEAADRKDEGAEGAEDKAIEEKRHELESRPASGCTADDPRDLERLRNIR